MRPRQAFQVYSNEHSSLVRKLVNYGRKKFYNIGPGRGSRPLQVKDKQASLFQKASGPV